MGRGRPLNRTPMGQFCDPTVRKRTQPSLPYNGKCRRLSETSRSTSSSSRSSSSSTSTTSSSSTATFSYSLSEAEVALIKD